MKKLFKIFAIIVIATLSSCAEPKSDEVALQLYSLRDLIGSPALYAENHDAVLTQIHDMGYTAVELASYGRGQLYGMEPEEFKADIEKHGLTILSSHVTYPLNQGQIESGDFSEALAWWDECIETHRRAGIKYLIFAYHNLFPSMQAMEATMAYFTEIAKRCQAAGIMFGYHSHSQEFRKVEGKEKMLDYMITHSDPSLMFFELDVYWAVYGQASPVEYFNRYPGRFKILHIKDYQELGQSGMVGFDAVFKNFDLAGTEHFVVEMENASDRNSINGVRKSIEYLKESGYIR